MQSTKKSDESFGPKLLRTPTIEWLMHVPPLTYLLRTHLSKLKHGKLSGGELFMDHIYVHGLDKPGTTHQAH